MLDVGRDRRRDLEAARAGADHRDPLAGRGRRRGPSGPSGTTGRRTCPGPGMSGRFGRLSWPTAEITARADERRLGAVGGRARAPTTSPTSSSQSAPSTSVSHRTCGSTPCLRHHAVEVRLQLGLLREELGPVVARLEAVAVEVVADVDAGARIGVLPPGAADAGVLLDDRERDAGLLEPDAGEQARLAAADHHDRERVAGRGVGGRGRPGAASAPSSSISSMSIGTYSAGTSSQTSQSIISLQQLGRDRLGLGTAAVAVVADHVERERAHLGLVLLGHVALHLVEEQARPARRRPRISSGSPDMCTSEQHQRRDADVEQRGRRSRRRTS